MAQAKIIETLDYGYHLMSDSTIMDSKGHIISAEDFAKMQQERQRNQLDWLDIDEDEFLDITSRALFICKTYETIKTMNVTGAEMAKNVTENAESNIGFAGIDNEANGFYLRIRENFGGATVIQFANAELGRVTYQVKRNRPELINELADVFETHFETKDQVGSIFAADSETSYTTKAFLKDGFVWKLVWKNGEFSNIKKTETRLTNSKEVNLKNSELKNSISAKLASGGFGNIR